LPIPALAFQAATYTLTDQLSQILQLALGWRFNALKAGWSVVAIDVCAIQKQNVKMYIEVESRAEALDQSHCTGSPVLKPVSSFVNQMCRNCAVNNAQHLAHRLRMGGEKES
jgi:hypothetical protein